MLDMEAFGGLLDRCELVIFDQCCYGADTVKPTMLLAANCDASSLVAKCDHKSRLFQDKKGPATQPRQHHRGFLRIFGNEIIFNKLRNRVSYVDASLDIIYY